MGAPAYLASEQIMGEPHSTRWDLFSLGIVLYQMVAGVPRFAGSSVAAVCAQILTTDPVEPSRRNPALPSGLDHIVMRCLSKKPEDRYPSGDALAASLYPLARRGPVPPPPSSMSWWSRPIQARDVWAFASVILLAGGCVPAGRAVVSLFHTPPAPAPITFTAPKAPDDLQDYPAAADALPISAESALSKSPTPPKRIRVTPPSASLAHRRPQVARAAPPTTPHTHFQL